MEDRNNTQGQRKSYRWIYDQYYGMMPHGLIDGREKTLRFLKESGVTKVILKDGSPSCGYSYIYDGTFTHTKVDDMGYTAKYLKENGIEVIFFNEG